MIYVSIIDMSNNRPDKKELLSGTLDLLVLKTLDTMGPLHGYGIARRIEQMSASVMRLSQGSIYPALIRLEQHGWIKTKWGVSETNRKVKFYSLTRAGATQLQVEVASWEQTTALVSPRAGGQGMSLRRLAHRLAGAGPPRSPRSRARRRGAGAPGAGRTGRPRARAVAGGGPARGAPRLRRHPADEGSAIATTAARAGSSTSSADIRYGAGVAAPRPGLHAGRGRRAGARHRRQHRDVQPGGRRAVQAAALSRARAHRPRLGDADRDHHQLDHDPELRRVQGSAAARSRRCRPNRTRRPRWRSTARRPA